MPKAIVNDYKTHIIKAGNTTYCGETIPQEKADKYISMGTRYMDDFMEEILSREDLPEVCQECKDSAGKRRF